MKSVGSEYLGKSLLALGVGIDPRKPGQVK